VVKKRATHPIKLDIDAARAQFARWIEDDSAQDSAAELAEENRAAELAGVNSDPSAWGKAGDLIALTVSGFAPAWEISDTERGEISGALADCLDHYFPGATTGIDNWHPLARLAWVLGALTVPRVNFVERPGGGIGIKLQPFKIGESENGNENSAATGRASDSDSGRDGQRQNVGRFTTDGE
jgi:hypothetical protein